MEGGSPLASSVLPGTVLAGKFQIERVLGQGGMGVVVAAQHLQLGQLVALKFLLPDAMRNPETSARFLREARASVRLKSEHVGRVIDVGMLDTGSPYIVMEYLEGEDLESFRRQHVRLPVVQAVDFVLQASEAVAEAHSLGIIHRDLKPANLFLTVRADGTPAVKVLDFGISKATHDSADFSLTRTATVMGSPGYMSPEQLRSARDVDHRTDVWALGVILFELVSGMSPFAADTITELTLKVAMDATPMMSVATPPGFEAVVRRCLEKDPDARFSTVAELAAALAPFGPANAGEMAQRIGRVQGGLTTQVKSKVLPAIATAPTTLSGSSIQAPAAGTAPPPVVGRKRLGLWLGIGGLVAAGAIAAAVLALGGGSGAADGGEGATGAATVGGGTTAGAGTTDTTATPATAGTATPAGTATTAGTGAATTAGTGAAAVTVDAGAETTTTGSTDATGVGTAASTGTGATAGTAAGTGRTGRTGTGRTGRTPRDRGAGSGTSAGTGAGTDFSDSRY